MLNVAILGANGFIGSRTVEMFHLGGLAEVRPIVRTMSSLARLSRFDLDCRVADAFDQSALRAAFEGCDVVVHAIAGDRKTIVETLAPTYQAAQEAGVRRLVYLSTASVHGQSPRPGTDENSPLNDRQPIDYNNSKVQAEQQLRELRKKGSVELVMLRPSIVFGPRSFWISSFASDLLAGQAYMVDGGKGICNSIYIDNLIHAIYLAMTASGVDGEAFLVGDDEEITWAEFYRPIAEALGFDLNQVPHVTYTPPIPTQKERLKAVLASPPSRVFLSLFPYKLRYAIRIGLCTLLKPPRPRFSPWTFPKLQQQSPPEPVATLEMAFLHQCQYKLPDTKARKMLGYQPIVSFPEACRRSITWLAFAGYPVIESYQLPSPQSPVPSAQPV
jgi:nucleoside-diphosphate-sugar epimerase